VSGENELTHNVIGMWGVVLYSVSVISPAFTFTIGSVASIVYAGRSAPLAFLIAGITTFSAVIALYIFSKYISNSGGYYKFIEAATQRASISKTVGLWYMSTILGVIIMGGGIVAWYVNSTMEILFNISVSPYLLILLSFTVPVLFLAVGYFRIRTAARTAITIGVVQLVVFSLFSLAFVLRTPYNGLFYFNLSNSANGLHGFFLAMILGAFFSYGGYGSVVSLGEEVKLSRRTMKKAIVYALAIMVTFETFAIYSIVAAAGPNINFLTSSIAPSLYISKMLFGTEAGFVVFVVGLIGIIYSLVLSGNSGARYVFALARDGLFSTNLARVHPRYKSPYMAVLWIFIIALIGNVITEIILIIFFGPSNGLFYSWAIWGTVVMIFSILISVSTNSSLAFFMRKIGKKLSVSTHILAPSISSLVMVIALYYSLFDLKSPMNSVYWVALSMILINGFIVYLRRNKIRTDNLEDLISE
jgi:amino acid transporter